MIYLYLDESGDLGFDFVNKKPTKFFTVCILLIKGREEKNKIEKMVKRTLRTKINRKNKRHRIAQELKATETTFEIKKYLFSKIKNINFEVYALTLNKRRVYEELANNKPRVYNWIARMLLDQVDFGSASQQIVLTLDRSKNKMQIKEFNQYIENQIQAKIAPKIPLHIHHEDSCVQHCLNIVDLFAWGVCRKYERQDYEWFEIFKGKVKYDDMYLR